MDLSQTVRPVSRPSACLDSTPGAPPPHLSNATCCTLRHPAWSAGYTEFRGNTLVRSDGISLRDTFMPDLPGKPYEAQCAPYGGTS